MNSFLRTAVSTALLAGLLTLATPVFAQDETERENLTDIREVNVVVETLAARAGTIGYELLCGVTARVDVSYV